MSADAAFSSLLRDLGQIDRAPLRGESAFTKQGELILHAFVRHGSYRSGAVYLKHPRDGSIRLAATTSECVASPSLSCEVPRDVLVVSAEDPLGEMMTPRAEAVVPLRDTREVFGLVALSGGRTVSHPEFLGIASSYVGALLANQRMATEMKEGEFQVKYRLWELESLYDIGLEISSTLDLDKLADEILVRTLSLLNARRAALYLKKGDRFALQQSFGDVRSQFFDEEITPEVAEKVLKKGSPLTFDKDANCIFPGCESFVALPIRTSSDVVGVLAAADRELRDGGVGPFDENDVRLLMRFANQAAIALENARLHRDALEKQRMEREMEVAATIQRDILPRALPKVEGFEIAALARPARQVGGDYYAFFQHEERLSMCVADVSGKSVPAAILVSAFHAALQLLFEQGRDLGEIATELNRHIHRWSSENKFITLILATVDREAETVRFVNAGHNPGYIVTPETLELLKSHGLPIGMMGGTRYLPQTKPFKPGSLLVLYSDGITEAENSAGDEFENSRLDQVLRAKATASAEDVRNAIEHAVDEFVGDAQQKDDQTLLVVKMV